LLVEYTRSGKATLSSDWLKKTRYWSNALECLLNTGRYFSAREEQQIKTIAEGFLARAFPQISTNREPLPECYDHSPPGALPIVIPVFASPLYQVLDGHHRIATAWVQGEKKIQALVQRKPVKTMLQKQVLDVVWQEGRAELYQPVEAPEFRTWPRVRNCHDRLSMMLALLADLGLDASNNNYLDVGSSYGWFVAQMSSLGYASAGVEIDGFAAKLAPVLYGSPNGAVVQSEAVRFLENIRRPIDIVSCFSVLHHFVLGKGSVKANEFAKLLAKATGKVLFIDTGEYHECWFKESLSEWTPEYIGLWLQGNTDFTRVIRLGRDSDNIGQFSNAYGRTLFACVR
jgi:SAM-dependent methyltransferase